MRKAVIINVSKRGWDAMIDVTLLPSFDLKELQLLLLKVKQLEQPDTWHEVDTHYYRITQYGENGEYISIQPLISASDGRLYAISNAYIIVNIRDGYVADHGFWHPSIVDTLLGALK